MNKAVLHPFEDPTRRCLKLADWPDPDRLAWEAALSPGDLLEGTMGAGHHWCDDTREKYRKGYGRWLTFLVSSGRLRRGDAPANRIDQEAVAAYVDELSGQVAPWTLWGRLAELLAVARAVAPEADWRWLRRIVGHLKTRVRPSRNKHLRLRPAGEIRAWALTRLDNLSHNPPARHAETSFRDALIIALLISCPTMRLRNLTMIEIGRHLVRLSDRYELRFQGSEMKARKPVEIPVPEALTPYLEQYISEIRPRLLARAATDASPTERLWITRYGAPLGEKMLYARISAVTAHAFGRPINPHLHRDCAVTMVALDDPTHIGIAPQILGHTDPRTTEKHYIQAQQIEAGRKYQASLRALRQASRTPTPRPNRRKEET